jgi:signal transduction histidine kinase
VPDDDAWLNELQVEIPDLRGLPALVSPLELRGGPPGMLVVFGSPESGEFDAEDARVLGSFAANAAGTIVTVQAVEAEKLRLTLEASERERRRWARELHDETLQELGALRVLLEGSADSGELPADSLRIAIEHVDRGIRNLQGLITELRPAALDDLGVGAAVDALTRQLGERFGVEIDVDVDLPYESEGGSRLEPELEAMIYRLIQEATNNAIKHADPKRISVTVNRSGETVEVMVVDDGSGFDVESAQRSFGLVGMEERVAQAGGLLRIRSARGRGTEVHAELPLAQLG